MTQRILTQLFPAVWNMSLTAGIIILVLLPVRLLLRRAPKAFSYALWAVVLFRLLCPVSIAVPHSLLGLLQAPARETTAVTSAVEFFRLDPVAAVPAAPGQTADPAPAPPQPSQTTDADTQAADAELEPVELVTVVWLAGIGLLLLYSAVTTLRLRRRLVGAVLLRGNIYQADHIDTPFVLGLLRPRIYLPSALTDREREYIILHEQHHLRRLDHITRQLAFAALCIHWFNPLVWLAFLLSSRDMEMSCDEAVVRQLGPAIRGDYSQSLLSLTVGRPIIAGSPLAFGECSTTSRIRNLLHWRRPRVWITALAGVLCAAVIAACAANPTGTGSDSTNDNVGVNTGDSADVDQALEETWSSVEAYVQHLMNAQQEVSYYVLGDPGPEERTAPVTDRRLAYLECSGQVAGLAPNGVLEAWEFNYLLQFDEAPDNVALVGGQYCDEDGWFDLEGQGGHVLVVLRRDDGSYEILYDAPVNDGGDFFGYHDTAEEAIYDWYVQYAGLDLPLYVEDWTGRFAQPEGFSMGNCPVHRYDVNGGYLYIPVSAWVMQEPSNCHWEWYSAYDTGSGLVVDYFTDSVEDECVTAEKQGFAPLDDTRQIWERRQDGYNSQYWFYPAADGIGCWRVWTLWTDEGITDYPYIAIEPEIMALMAESFTPVADS